MNRTVYIYLLRTYGRHPGIWAGFITELVRTLLQRVWVAVIVAQVAACLATGDVEGAKQNAILFLIVYCAAAIIGAIGDLVAILTEDDEYEKLTVQYYKKLVGKDMAFYRDNQTGYLVGLFRQFLDSSMLLVRLFRVDIIRMVVSLVAPAIVLLAINWRLGLVVCGILGIQIMYVFWSSRQANTWRKRSHEVYRKLTGEVSDHITNIVAFKSGGAEKRGLHKVQQLSKQETHTFWQRRKLGVLFDLPRELITAAGVTLAFLVVVNGAAHDRHAVGLIILTLTYMFQIVRSVGELPNLMIQHDDMITKLHPTLGYLSSEHEAVRDPAKPIKLRLVKGEITIEHIGFAYSTHDKQDRQVTVFKNLNLTIAGGQRVGIVGLSGAGKSTLASLLMRFDDVQNGAIRIDGIDIRDVTQSDIHKNIAYVPQEPLLFHSTIRENIAYFADKASQTDIERAAKAAHAHEFIKKLPAGYDTVVGERGIKLSGGQKQRIVIARAILKNAPIMIFDEATSALDTESEKIIQKALPKIIGAHTAVVIAHRLSTVANLDRILVMHDGKVIEDGTHDELLALQGRYHSLWQKQIAQDAEA